MLLLPLLLAVYQSHAGLAQMRRETGRALGTFADVVDERDPYTFHHYARVAEHVRELAERLGFSATDVSRLRWAGEVAVQVRLARQLGHRRRLQPHRSLNRSMNGQVDRYTDVYRRRATRSRGVPGFQPESAAPDRSIEPSIHSLKAMSMLEHDLVSASVSALGVRCRHARAVLRTPEPRNRRQCQRGSALTARARSLPCRRSKVRVPSSASWEAPSRGFRFLRRQRESVRGREGLRGGD